MVVDIFTLSLSLSLSLSSLIVKIVTRVLLVANVSLVFVAFAFVWNLYSCIIINFQSGPMTVVNDDVVVISGK